MPRRLTNAMIATGFPWCIAGGWAACPQLASDQDVWILARAPDPEVVLAERDRLLDAFPEITPQGNLSLVDTQAMYGDLGQTIAKVGTIDTRHILVTGADGVRDLLDAFDISTHQCAITPEFQFVKGRCWTPITVMPQKLRQTEKTDARFEKIAARYATFRSSPDANTARLVQHAQDRHLGGTPV